MTWSTAFVRAVVIVAYFVLCTAWFPDRLLRTGMLTGAPPIVWGLVASSVWAVALGLGMWALRRLQKRDTI